jgi:ribosomal-protein-alanine N-acetyltransferase
MYKLEDHPFVEIQTERLLLRKLKKSDVDAIFEIRSSAEVSKYIHRHLITEKKQAETFLDTILDGIQKNQFYYWGICTQENPDRLMGTICLWNFSFQDYRAEIGFELLPQFHKKGYMRESLQAVLELAFDQYGLHKITGYIDPDNLPGIYLLKKNGFSKEAHFEEHIFFDGEFYDIAVYSIINRKY